MTKFIEIPAAQAIISRRSKAFGVGINDAKYLTQPIVGGVACYCPYYTAWQSMMKRCYCEKTQKRQPTYIGCSVCPDWAVFSNFRAWMNSQDWNGKALDKDLLVSGNKVYGPEFCMFVSVGLNSLLTNAKAIRGDLPQGVSFEVKNKSNNKYYRARCNVNGKSKHIGYFSSVNQAEYAYLKFKSNLILEKSFSDEAVSIPKLQAALIRHSKEFNNKAELLKWN
tara:strand:+ start:130 stop:798 length:669 start_codon:yes stop_codon:yes gene_type:complete